MIEMNRQEGEKIPSAVIASLAGDSVAIPQDKKQVVVFWATWCGPCKVELARMNRMVKSGDIRPESVFAVSVGEKKEIVERHSNEHDYRFIVGYDESGKVGRQFKISATPTILFVREDGSVEWMTMGVSPSLELRMKSFLN